jgi:hypothetical protein
VSLVIGQFIKMRTSFVDSEGSVTKLGKAAKAAGFALATLAISEAVFTAMNDASGAAMELEDNINTLIGTLGTLVGGKSTPIGKATGDFAALAQAEDAALKVSHLWTDWGKKIKIAGATAQQPIEDIDAAFNKLLKTGGTTAAEALIKDWRKVANTLDHSSQQYKDNIMLIQRYEARIKSLSSATTGLATINTAAASAADAAAKAEAEAQLRSEAAAAAAKAYAAKLQELRKALGSDFVAASKAATQALEDAKGKFDSYAQSVASSIQSAYTFAGALAAVKASADAVTTAQDAVTSATDAVGAAQRKVRDTTWALTDAQEKLTVAQRMNNDVVSAQQNLTRAQEDAADAVLDLAKANDTLNKATTAANTATAQTGKTFIDRLTEQAKTATDFADRVQRLIAMGISQDSLQLVLDAGAEAGGKIADELIAGGQAAVDQADALTQSVKDAAVRAGTDAATQYYSEGVTLATNLVNGINSVIKNYKIKLASKGLTDKQLAKLKKNFAVDVGFQFSTAQVDVPELADGGIVPATRGGRLIRVAEAGQDEAIIPLSRGNMTQQPSTTSVTIHVNGGDPNAVVDALRRYVRQNGSLGWLV